MNYKDLKAWQKGLDLVESIYVNTKVLPSEEQYGLVSQMRKAAVSIPSNIAEGHGRKHTKAYLNHLSIAFGSLMELETQIEICKRLAFIKEDLINKLLEQTDELGKIISGLRRSLQ